MSFVICIAGDGRGGSDRSVEYRADDRRGEYVGGGRNDGCVACGS